MNFKCSEPPGPRDNVLLIADFIELMAWKYGRISVGELRAILGREEDEAAGGRGEWDGFDGDEAILTLVYDALYEMDQRVRKCAGRYPFSIEGDTALLLEEKENDVNSLYLYLLLATHLSMDNQSRFGGMDGALLLEELGAEVLEEYLGKSRAKSMVFGTASQHGFTEKIKNLCNQLGERTGPTERALKLTRANDGGLDVVAWVPFADRGPGKVIVFAQCKTGTNWKNKTTRLQPVDWCRIWMESSSTIHPLRAFIIADFTPNDRKTYNNIYNLASEAGLWFDRFRIMDCAANVSDELRARIILWTLAARDQCLDSLAGE